MKLEELRLDCAIKQKRGLHIIIASVIIWIAILFIQLTSMDQLTKNLFTFICTAPLLPISFIVSKVIKVDFENKTNPLSKLGLLFSVNQILYLLIAMWVYNAVPEKMLMIMAIIFGAHLMPYSWLYKSKVYFILSIIIPVLALIIGVVYGAVILAIMMIFIEVIFCIGLAIENKNL